MKKLAPLLTLGLFLSFQLFQFCDESHDACEALSQTIYSFSGKGPALLNSTPTDDPDAGIPLVVGRTLAHGRVTTHCALIAHPFCPAFSTLAAQFVSQVQAQDRSPPRSQIARFTQPVVSRLLAFTPARILAPPLS